MENLPKFLIIEIYSYLSNWKDSAAFRSVCKKYRKVCMLPRLKFSNQYLINKNDDFQFMIHPVILLNTYAINYQSKKIKPDVVYFHLMGNSRHSMFTIKESVEMARYCFCDNNFKVFEKYIPNFVISDTMLFELLFSKKYINRLKFLDLINKCENFQQDGDYDVPDKLLNFKPDKKFIKKMCEYPRYRQTLLDFATLKQCKKIAKIIYKYLKLTLSEQDHYISYHRYGSKLLRFFKDSTFEPIYIFKHIIRKDPNVSLEIVKKCHGFSTFKDIQRAIIHGRQDIAEYIISQIGGGDFYDDDSYD